VFYYNNKEVSEARKINQLPDGMAFEEYCQEYVKKLGYTTKSRQNYDGGIDIRATKILDNNETEYALIQCKHWNTPIPPGEMRAFKASCDEEQSEYKKVKIFMTSNKFSPGAREYAEKYNIKLIDGNDLLK
jgi:restriction system protein